MATIFTKIVNGEIPCYKIAEDEHHLAFLDIQPLKEGHTLVIPKQEIDYIFDLEEDDLASLHVFASKVAKALEAVVPCQRIGVAVIGLEVPHAHIHLVPMDKVEDINFSKAKLSIDAEEMKSIANRISQSYKIKYG